MQAFKIGASLGAKASFSPICKRPLPQIFETRRFLNLTSTFDRFSKEIAPWVGQAFHRPNACSILICCCGSQSKCLLPRPRPRRRKSLQRPDPPLPMLSHANTPSIYTSECVSFLYEHWISFVKSTLWPHCGYLGRKTDSPGLCPGPWGGIQEESTKGYQRDPVICHEGDGTQRISYTSPIALI